MTNQRTREKATATMAWQGLVLDVKAEPLGFLME